MAALGDSRILVVSGGPNRDEIYSSVGGWTRQAAGQGWPPYPHLFLLETGKLFYSGGHLGGSGGLGPGILDLASPGTLTGVTTPSNFDLNHRDQCGSVMLPPAQDQKVMIMGGGIPQSLACMSSI